MESNLAFESVHAIMFVAYYALLSQDWNANIISVICISLFSVIMHATGSAIF